MSEMELISSLHHWVNDGLMAIFFFVVGLEIKREIMGGELSSIKKASLPIAAAIGGMVLPAILYTVVTINYPEFAKGWGVPMATDIAFALGLFALFGSKLPLTLKLFLLSVAIFDDIGAIVIIALFFFSFVTSRIEATKTKTDREEMCRTVSSSRRTDYSQRQSLCVL